MRLKGMPINTPLVLGLKKKNLVVRTGFSSTPGVTPNPVPIITLVPSYLDTLGASYLEIQGTNFLSPSKLFICGLDVTADTVMFGGSIYYIDSGYPTTDMSALLQSIATGQGASTITFVVSNPTPGGGDSNTVTMSGYPVSHSAASVNSDCLLYQTYWDGTAVDHSSHGNNGTVTLGAGSFSIFGLTFDGTSTMVAIPTIDGATGFSVLVAFYTFPGEGQPFIFSTSGPAAYGNMQFLPAEAEYVNVSWQDTEGHLHVAAADIPGFATNNGWAIFGITVDYAANTGKAFFNGTFTDLTFTGLAGKSPAPNTSATIGEDTLTGVYVYGILGEIFIDQVAVANSVFTSRYNTIKAGYGL